MTSLPGTPSSWSPATATPVNCPSIAANSATPVILATLVDVVCCWWRVEEDFQMAKGVAGLDQGQTTCCTGPPGSVSTGNRLHYVSYEWTRAGSTDIRTPDDCTPAGP
ncbi:hypothetical protein GCM10015535_18460 [Streptomyces gelaticus]|uniref:Uncharacterized protein n=1 Tax=Streptomyces gelaticus TaxID=285446 RepID=A0ABQ2VUU5_9ACTN|nr:hypothetical protein GCM10015535_18460 [Streptomyces gelaticus]